MISTTVDKTAVITAERGRPAAEMREIFGEKYKSSRIVLTARFEGEWPTKREMREELEDCLAELLNAFEAEM